MNCINKYKLNLIVKIRLLWNQHAEWTRMAINAIVLRLPNEQEEVNRLLRNPIDFKKVLEIYYGKKNASRFTDLLTEHLMLAADLINAMIADNRKQAEKIARIWYKNGDEIALFLSDLNPYWSYKEWKDMFFTHLGYVLDLATTMINQQYEANIRIYDKLELEAMEMADVMSYGNIRQFSKKF